MAPAPKHESADFQRFQSLARRILTTAKTELEKAGQKKQARPARKKTHR